MLKQERNVEKCTKLDSTGKKTYYNNKKDGEATSEEGTDENHFPHILTSYIYNHYLHQGSRIRT